MRLVAAEMVRAGARMPAAQAANANAFHDGDELRGVAPVARRDQQGQRTAAALPGKVDLAG
ncbi:hypothetical protein GCM10010304_79660 [Streptomyces roseoviolaceus]